VKIFSKPKLGRYRDAAHLARGDQLSIETDKLVTWNWDSQIYDVQSVQEVGPNPGVGPMFRPALPNSKGPG
jgi:hypothetical protein